jgi:hypothetical protein
MTLAANYVAWSKRQDGWKDHGWKDQPGDGRSRARVDGHASLKAG